MNEPDDLPPTEFDNEELLQLVQAASLLFPLFQSLVAAGFTENQALRFLAYWMSANADTSNSGF